MAQITNQELKEKVDSLDARIKLLHAQGKIKPMSVRESMGAVSQIKCDLLNLKVASYHLMDIFTDMVDSATQGNTEIQKNALYLASLEKMSLNEAAGRSLGGGE